MSAITLIKPPPSAVGDRLAGGAAPDAPADRGGEVSDADAASFHAVRSRLFGIAYRVLGDATEADDVVQDTWIHWQTTDRSAVRDAAAFLATTTRHLAIHVIQSARARRETYVGPQPVEAVDLDADPACDVERREALELALRTLLEKLSPTERAAYLLREAFDYRYRELGAVLELSEANARQVVTRARRRLSGEPDRPVGAAQDFGSLVTSHAAVRSSLVPSRSTHEARPGSPSRKDRSPCHARSFSSTAPLPSRRVGTA